MTEKDRSIFLEPMEESQMTLGSEFETEVGQSQLERATTISNGKKPEYYIKSLRLVNFKGFVEFEIQLGRFNVIVGGNNSGKSTILRAIRLAYDLAGLHFFRFKGGIAEFHPGRSVPKSYLPVAQLRDLWPGGRMRQGNKWSPAELQIEFDSGHVMKFGIIGPWNAANSRIDIPKALPEALFGSFLNNPPEFVPASIGIVAEEEFRTPARLSALASSGRHNEVVRNYLNFLSETQRNELSEILRRYFNAEIELPKFDPNSEQFLSVVYRGSEGDHDIYSAGGGFLQIVEVLAFISKSEPGVILLDEPDSHLHSSLQRALVDILESLASKRRFQVIMATHSKEIINYVDPSRLLPVDRKNRVAHSLTKETGTVTVLKELGVLDNVDAYQIVKNRVVLAVEGPTDRDLLPKIAAKLGRTIFDGANRISILPAGGVDKLIDGTALNLIEQFLGQPLKCVLLRDRDGLPDDLLDELGGKAKRTLLIWPFDCIESYLVCAAPLHRIITEELGEQAAPPLADIEKLVSDALSDAEDRTKDRVSAKIIDINFRITRTRLETTYSNPLARAAVEDAKANDGSIIRFAHGKDLLSDIRRRIQTAYKVSFGNARVIESMRPEEFHADLNIIIQKIEETLF